VNANEVAIMSVLKNMDVQYCHVGIDEPITAGPVLTSIEGKPYALVGTKEGTLVKIPLLFSRSDEQRNDYEKVKLVERKITNLKQLFLDQEFSTSVMDIKVLNSELILAVLQEGSIFIVNGTAAKKVFEANGSINCRIEMFESGKKTYIAIGSNDGFLYVISPEGKLIAKANCGTPINASPSYCEPSSILCGCDSGQLICFNFDSKKGSLEKRWAFTTNKPIVTKPVIDNLFNDERQFILFGGTDKNLYCLNDDGTLFWNYQTEGRIIADAYVEDINGDNIKEVLFGSCDDKLYVLNAYGNELWNFETDFWIGTSPSVLSIERAREKYVFAGSYDNKVYCFSPQADFVPGFFSGATGIIQQSASFENPDIEESSGYFAKKLFEKSLNGLIIGLETHSSFKTVTAASSKGDVFSIYFDESPHKHSR